MPAVSPADPFCHSIGNSPADKGPMIDIELPDLLSHVFKVFEENGSFSSTINPRQWTKRSVRIHADPLFLRHLLLQQLPVAFEFPAIKAGNSGKQSRHKRRQQAPSENSSQKHYLNVVVNGAVVIEHHRQRATRL